jgi:hypothetical protein
MDTLAIAAGGMQTANAWLFTAARNIAASDGGPNPVDAVDAFVAAPLAYAANARVMDVAVATTRCLFDALA